MPLLPDTLHIDLLTNQDYLSGALFDASGNLVVTGTFQNDTLVTFDNSVSGWAMDITGTGLSFDNTTGAFLSGTLRGVTFIDPTGHVAADYRLPPIAAVDLSTAMAAYKAGNPAPMETFLDGYRTQIDASLSPVGVSVDTTGGQKDMFTGSSHDDSAILGAFRDRAMGGGGNDHIDGGAGRDILKGGAGADMLIGGKGNDRLHGGGGRDVLVGNGGDDLLRGDSGRDILRGGNGGDSLHGGAGNDRLFGGSGVDMIHGDKGDDILVGGKGADYFIFRTGDGHDVIRDFDVHDPGRELLIMNDTALALPGHSPTEDYNAMVANNMTQTAHGVEITIGADSITIRGVTIADLTIDHFSFI